MDARELLVRYPLNRLFDDIFRTSPSDNPNISFSLNVGENRFAADQLDFFKPCVTFNKTNTFKWFKENVYELPSDYNPEDKVKAFEKSLESHPFPIGVIYKSAQKAILEDALREESNVGSTPLYLHEVDFQRLNEEMDKYI